METSQGGSVVQSMGSVNYNRSNTGSMATLPHFPKQRPARHSACAVAVTWCYAWLTQGRLPVAQCLFLGIGARQLHTVIVRGAHRPRYVPLMKTVTINNNQTTVQRR